MKGKYHRRPGWQKECRRGAGERERTVRHATKFQLKRLHGCHMHGWLASYRWQKSGIWQAN
jgi:hypothetical protein